MFFFTNRYYNIKVENFFFILVSNSFMQNYHKIWTFSLVWLQVFVSASPEHWCRIPELDNLTAGIMSLEERRGLSLPYKNKSDGRKEYSKCYMYDVNYTAIIEAWLSSGGYENLSNPEFADTGGGSTVQRADPDQPFGEESYGSTVNPTSLLRFPRRLPPPPVSDPSWPKVKCRWGWNYDKRDYDSTLVTEVNSTRAAFRSLSLYFIFLNLH